MARQHPCISRAAITAFSIHAFPPAEEILRFHTPGYLAKCKEVSSAATGGQVGHELHISHGGFDIAALSCGGVLAAVEAVMAGKIHNAYALVRPPGHHAERDHGHGFCMFSNVSLAAAHALANLGAKRVAIVDWDVHHGEWWSTSRRRPGHRCNPVGA